MTQLPQDFAKSQSSPICVQRIDAAAGSIPSPHASPSTIASHDEIDSLIELISNDLLLEEQ